MKTNRKLLVAVVLIAAGATGLALNGRTRGQVIDVLKQLSHAGSHGEYRPPDRDWLSSSRSKTPWDRTLALTDEQIDAIGLKTVAVKEQTDPTSLHSLATPSTTPPGSPSSAPSSTAASTGSSWISAQP